LREVREEADAGAARLAAAFLLLFGLSGCGFYVPSLRDWPNNDEPGAVAMVHAIVRSVECELKNAVTTVVNNDIRAARARASHRTYTDFLNNWGAEVLFTFTIIEKTGVNLTATWIPPLPAPTVFTIGGNVAASPQATRIEKMNFFYTVKDLYLRDGQVCDASGEDPSGSFLIKNDLKIAELLDIRITPVVTGNATAPGTATSSGDKNVLSHEITFEVVTSGGITPTWTLTRATITRATINGTGTFLSGSRDWTHDLIITFGPLDKSRGGRSLIAIAEQSHAVSQINSGVTTGFRSVLVP
jgi:hypothetical protein